MSIDTLFKLSQKQAEYRAWQKATQPSRVFSKPINMMKGK